VWENARRHYHSAVDAAIVTTLGDVGDH